MIDLRLHEQVVEQGRLLLELLSVVREHNGDAAIDDDATIIAERLFSGLEQLYEELDAVMLSWTSRDQLAGEQLAPQYAYAQIIGCVREQVARYVEPGETVAVVSRGDSRLVDLPDRQGWHYPQNKAGTWAGYHPRDGAHALALLDELRARGARYLVVPATSAWWLDWYSELAAFLDQSCTTLVRDDRLALFALPAWDMDAAPLSYVMSRMIPIGATVFEVAVDGPANGRLVTRVHSAWGTDDGEELVIEDGQLTLPLATATAAPQLFLVVDAEVRARLSQLGECVPEMSRGMKCLFDSAAVGAIYEISERGRLVEEATA